MNPLARDTLRRVQREAAQELDPVEDFDRIKFLVDASETATNADESPAFTAQLIPSKKVGNVVLWRLSHGAKTFYQREIFDRLTDEDSELSELAVPWCMAMSRTPEILWELSGDLAAIRKAVKRWEKSLTCSTEELFGGVHALLDMVRGVYTSELEQAREMLLDASRQWADNPTEERDITLKRAVRCYVDSDKFEAGGGSKSKGLAATIQSICKETGRSIEDIVWRTPEEEIIMLVSQYDETGEKQSSVKKRAFFKFHAEAEKLKQYLIEKRKEASNGG